MVDGQHGPIGQYVHLNLSSLVLDPVRIQSLPLMAPPAKATRSRHVPANVINLMHRVSIYICIYYKIYIFYSLLVYICEKQLSMK